MASRPDNQFQGVAAVYDQIMAGVPYRHWVDYLEELWEWFDCQPRSVLELACGTGSVMDALRQRGYEVAGVDNSAPMLEIAREKLGPETRLWLQDAASLDLDEQFDACVCLFDSLNYLLEWEDLRDCCAGVCRALHPGGLFVFDINSVRALKSHLFTQQGRDEDESVSYDWRSRWDPGQRLCTIEMEYNVRRNGVVETFHETHVQRAYTLDELQAAICEGGLRFLAAYDAYSFRSAQPESDRHYLIAQRPE